MRLKPRVLARGFLDLPGANAAGADVQTLDRFADHYPNRLKVRHPAAARHIVGVADPVSEDRSLAADFTHFCHVGNSLK